MGIRVVCPNGHRLHLKASLAGHRGLCPDCNARFRIPFESSDARQPHAEARKKKVAVDRWTTRGRSGLNAVTNANDGPVTPTPQAATETVEREQIAAGKGGIGHPRVVAPANPVPQAAPIRTADATPSDPQAPVAIAPPSAAADTLLPVWFVQPPDGGQYGPATDQVLLEWIEEGRVTDDCLVWRDGWPDWRPATSVLTRLQATAATTQNTQAIIDSPHSYATRVARRRRISKRGMVFLILAGMIGLLVVAGVFVLLQNNGLSFGPAAN